MLLRDEDALRRQQRISHAHPSAKPEAQQGNGQAELSGPGGQTLRSALVFQKTLPRGSSSVSKSGRSGQRPLKGPPVFQSVGQCLAVTTDHPRPLVQVPSLSSKLDKHVGLRIGLLLMDGGPSAVSRLVSSRAVDSINRGPGRALAHIGKKILERAPAIANSYSDSPISCVGSMSWSRASTHHIRPSRVCLGVFAARSVAVFDTSFHAISLPENNAPVTCLRGAT